MENYEVAKVIGEGSFGRALLCRRKRDMKMCIIKQIALGHLAPKEAKQTRQEASLLAKLNHPNIVGFWDSFVRSSALFIVMEFADGGDLDQFIKRRRGRLMSEGEVLQLFVQISLAIKHTHDRKILHRDLKPGNIFLTSSGLVKLGDFGVSRVLKNTGEFACTQIGTPYYMSPEIMANKRYNSKTDIWSLGCILYEIMCLKLPFDGASMPQLCQNIQSGNGAVICPSLPYSFALKDLCKDMLRNNSILRPGINAILGRPVVKDRISSFLDASKRRREFSHTVIHGMQILSVSPQPIKISEREKERDSDKAQLRMDSDRARRDAERGRIRQLISKAEERDQAASPKDQQRGDQRGEHRGEQRGAREREPNNVQKVVLQEMEEIRKQKEEALLRERKEKEERRREEARKEEARREMEKEERRKNDVRREMDKEEIRKEGIRREMDRVRSHEAARKDREQLIKQSEEALNLASRQASERRNALPVERANEQRRGTPVEARPQRIEAIAPPAVSPVARLDRDLRAMEIGPAESKVKKFSAADVPLPLPPRQVQPIRVRESPLQFPLRATPPPALSPIEGKAPPTPPPAVTPLIPVIPEKDDGVEIRLKARENLMRFEKERVERQAKMDKKVQERARKNRERLLELQSLSPGASPSPVALQPLPQPRKQSEEAHPTSAQKQAAEQHFFPPPPETAKAPKSSPPALDGKPIVIPITIPEEGALAIKTSSIETAAILSTLAKRKIPQSPEVERGNAAYLAFEGKRPFELEKHYPSPFIFSNDAPYDKGMDMDEGAAAAGGMNSMLELQSSMELAVEYTELFAQMQEIVGASPLEGENEDTGDLIIIPDDDDDTFGGGDEE